MDFREGREMAKRLSADKKNTKEAIKMLDKAGKVITGKKRRKKSTVEKVIRAILK